MAHRISPAWWPLLGLSSPFLLSFLMVRNRTYRQNVLEASRINQERMEKAKPLEMPPLEHLELTVLVEEKVEPGFLSAPGVSYLLQTERGSLLFDVGYGPETPALARNAARLGFAMDQADALAISHLHPDHMGGFKASRNQKVILPPEFFVPKGLPCFLPAPAGAEGFQAKVVATPRMLAGGIFSTGPLARSLFLMGWTEEQALVARLKDKGLVVITGCGHPTIETIIQMVKRISDEPIYAIGGGLHFPVTDSPLRKAGIKLQMIWGTGKPPWQRITKTDLERTIGHLNAIRPRHVFLSGHDTCDYALDRFQNALKPETRVLKAGATYRL